MAPSSVSPEFLGVEALAAMLSVSVHTIVAWRKRQVLPPAYKFGKALRWARADIEQWARNHREAKAGVKYGYQAFQRRSSK